MPKILLVENNTLTRKLLDRRLQHSGYEVLIATDGDQGVTLAINRQPDLIIMATDLPVMNGWQAIKILKASDTTTHIPVIALTTDSKSGSWKTALEVGCNDYDTKPIVLKRLLGKIEILLGVESTQPTQTKSTSVEIPETRNSPFSDLAGVEPSAAIPTSDDASNGLLKGRYEVGQVLYETPFGQRFLAKDLKASMSESVIINAFNLPIDNPTLLTLVRDYLATEMDFLKVISKQEDIATCLDYFEQGDTFYWVQSHIVGNSLTEELDSAQSMGYVLQLTNSLLNSVHPFHQGQIAHCECHPQSFIRRQSDNRIVLVEYGLLKRM